MKTDEAVEQMVAEKQQERGRTVLVNIRYWRGPEGIVVETQRKRHAKSRQMARKRFVHISRASENRVLRALGKRRGGWRRSGGLDENGHTTWTVTRENS